MAHKKEVNWVNHFKSFLININGMKMVTINMCPQGINDRRIQI